MITKDVLYWKDENGNRWTITDEITKKVAVKKSQSLFNCVNCIDCESCVNCIDCESCVNCVECVECIECSDCKFCERAEYKTNTKFLNASLLHEILNNYMSTCQTAKKFGVNSGAVSRYVNEGRIKGAVKVGDSWFIPIDAIKPKDKRFRN